MLEGKNGDRHAAAMRDLDLMRFPQDLRTPFQLPILAQSQRQRSCSPSPRSPPPQRVLPAVPILHTNTYASHLSIPPHWIPGRSDPPP